MIFHKQACADEIIRLRMELDASAKEYAPKDELKPEDATRISLLSDNERQYRLVAHLEKLCFGEIVRAAQEKQKAEREAEDKIMRKAWAQQYLRGAKLS